MRPPDRPAAGDSGDHSADDDTRLVGPPGDRRRVRDLEAVGGGSLDGDRVEVSVDATRYRVRRADGAEETYVVRRLPGGRAALVFEG